MNPAHVLRLAHLHIVVDDLDIASEFYRTVLDFVEFQSHADLGNVGLSTYYGFGDEPDSLNVSLRFLAWPGVLTIKLVRALYEGHGAPSGTTSSDPRVVNKGLGPISIVVDDLESAYEKLRRYAHAYTPEFKVVLLSPPVFLSPLRPDQIGATRHSVLYGDEEVLGEIAKAFPTRAKFQLVDPFGVRWEFNNDVL